MQSRKVNSVDWNEQTKAEEWRKSWADIVNQYSSEHDVKERIDHRSYERQGVNKIPTVHMGVAASQMERKGVKTDRGNINRQAEVSNNQMKQLKARIRKAKDGLYALPINDAPGIVDIMGRIADGRNLETNWQKVRNLQTQAKVRMCLQTNKITDMTHLVQKIESINKEYKDLADGIKAAERRLDTLETHIGQQETHIKHKAVYNEYARLDPKKREPFYAKHKTEIDLFKNAREYINAVMNGRTDPVPIKEWKAEQKNLTIKVWYNLNK